MEGPVEATGSWPWWGRERAFAGQGHFPASRKELEAVFLRDIWKGKNELLAEGDAATGVGCTRMVRGVIREELVAKENPSRRSTVYTHKVHKDDCGWGFKFPVYAHQGTVSLEERSATRTKVTWKIAIKPLPILGFVACLLCRMVLPGLFARFAKFVAASKKRT